MVKIEDSPKKLTPGHSFALSCMYTQNQLRPDQPFYSSYQDTLGIYLNRNCLAVVRGGGAYLPFQGECEQPAPGGGWAKVASYLVTEGCALYVHVKELGLPLLEEGGV